MRETGTGADERLQVSHQKAAQKTMKQFLRCEKRDAT